MQKTIISFLTLILIVLVNGCTFVTDYHHYEICSSVSGSRRDSSDGPWVSVTIVPTITTRTIVPLFYDKDIYKEPYSYHFTIHGDFVKIESVTTTFILNGEPQDLFPITPEWLNERRKKTTYGHVYFPAGKMDFPFAWDEIKHLEMDIKFIAIDENGNPIEYREKKILKKHYYKRTGNRAWDTMMSV